MKKPRRLHGDVFFYVEGGHLLKVNWLAQTLIMINQKVSKAMRLLKRCQSTNFKNINKLLQKENCYESLLCFINKNVSSKQKKISSPK